MSLREKKKKQTNKKLRDALQRLIDKKPTNRELKKRDNVKVNDLNVQKEAGVSIGAIRHHPDVATLIKNHQLGLSTETPCVSSNEAEIVLRAQIEDLKEKLATTKKKLKKETDLKKEYSEKAIRLESENLRLVGDQHQLTQALFNAVPIEARNKLFKRAYTNINVLTFPDGGKE
tara:strand:+ start:106 stop:627 length:522 start_codon:yes stop_codon:yes gene_type:complete